MLRRQPSVDRRATKLASAVATIAVASALLASVAPSLFAGIVSAQTAFQPNPNCTPNVVPTGQANPPGEPEPLAPVWCFTLSPGPTTRVTGANDWLDEFETNVPMQRLNDGDMDYLVFANLHSGGTNRTQHFVNNNHWMDDNAGGFTGGALLRPNRSFAFEGGKLVVEGDVAAGMACYEDACNNVNGGDVAWPEIVVATAPAPTGRVVDALYSYGQFGGAWAVGCRVHARGVATCAVESPAPTGKPGNDTFPCFSFGTFRLIEISGFQQCGASHTGGDEGDLAPRGSVWRLCRPDQIDLFCRDRFRMEVTKAGLSLYVNGQLYFRDADWPVGYQLPDSVLSAPWYAYYADWQDRPAAPAYRFHWGYLAVNPHTPDGSPKPPTAAPSYCPDMPQFTCDMSTDAMPTPTSTSTSTPT